ncbi:MAG TPA: tetratricopeptide repeat protein [Longimicrobiales bacterium]|nr:tetratricopeptide repeat protein [Longimicrobiales bacterium]
MKRNVTRVLIWYLVAAWVVIQVADVVSPALALRIPLVRYLIYLAIAGLPIALLVGWLRKGPDESKPVSAKKVVEGKPLTPEAYELYVRANHLATQSSKWTEAIAAYRDCLNLDPEFAPAWARMARCYRLLAKWGRDDAETDSNLAEAIKCFDRALELNPDLPLTHSLYAQLEIDTGRPEEAMVRLLARAQTGAADAEIHAALVQAFRFVGLLDESVAAYERAIKLDPNVRTGIAHTYFMLSRYDDALNEYRNADIGYLEALALAMLGRSEEAIVLLRTREEAGSVLGPYLGSLRALLEGNRDEAMEKMSQALTQALTRDGEAVFYLARQYAYLGEADNAMELLQHSIKSGFVCYPRFKADPWLDALRDTNTFKGLLRAAETRHRQAQESFRIVSA